MRLYGLLGGGKYVSICKACSKLERSGGMLPQKILILDFLLDTICGIWDCFHTFNLHLSGVNYDFGPGILCCCFFVVVVVVALFCR